MKTHTSITAANCITCLRIVLTFVWLGFASQISLLAIDYDVFSSFSCFVALFYILLAFTDFLDGFIARRQHSVSTLGIYLDPISDKILVLAGLLVLFSWHYVNGFVILLIFARDFLVDALRLVAATKNIVVAASVLGKIKTATTQISVSMYLLAAVGFGPVGGSVCYLLGAVLLCIALVFTIWSALDYYAKVSKKLHHA